MSAIENENAGKPAFVLLSLGSNLGDRKSRIEIAINLLQNGILEKSMISSFYETEPVGFADQPWFLNVAVSGYTNLSINTFLEKCKKIESKIGRIERERWHEREIDIDLLIFDNLIIHNDEIDVPHPRLIDRRFVLVPSSEIAPNQVHPESGKTILDHLKECNDISEVIKII